MKSIFHKKIHCLHCNGNFKRRRNRNKYVWICSRTSNGYSNCPNIVLDENFLIDCINKRYEIRMGKALTPDEISEKVEWMEIEDSLLFKIKLIDFDDCIEYGRTFVNY